jgi:putative transposase
MPWQTTDPVNERMRFVSAYQSGLYGMSELCLRYGISRETGYTWVGRCAAEGPAGLVDRSHAPKHCPHRLSPDIAALLLAARASHPHWGPRKLLAWLEPRHPGVALPAASTVGELLKREGLVQPRSRHRRGTHPGRKPLLALAPNQVWAADFKGQFRTGDGVECYPLTITDSHSRFLLCCKALDSVATAGTKAGFTACFREYGLPEAIRTDNGTPFAAATPLGLTRLNAWWTQLGIVHDRIEPGRPDQNGAHERMHRTMKAETTRPPGQDQAHQQKIFDRWRWEFDFERPHEALGQQPPATVYEASPREMPARLPEPVYAGHCEVRRVRRMGTVKFRGHEIYLSEVLAHERVALEEVEDGIWSIYFHARLVGRLDERTHRVSG